MEGIIVNYRGSRRVKHTLQMIVEVAGVESKDKASSLIGKKVVWTTPGKKQMSGVVSGAHGNSGALRVRFDIGMPGQSIGQKVKIE